MTIRLAVPDTTALTAGLAELREAISAYTGGNARIVQNGAAALWIGLPDHDPLFNQQCRKDGSWPNARIGLQGYVLVIAPDQIRLAAQEPVGLFYGIQTLVQLLRNSDDSRLSCRTIVDWPELAWRGIMDDISRGPVPTTPFVKQ
ncbi:MAG TPA: glycoside hydrolase family 20 zincin-like fold domain-containing protein, partial [bacterium]|nr:glycoside hydrolase family 20 zincin-like fold domain-containing protein [bacterium]